MSKYKGSVELAVSRLRILKELGAEWCQPVIEDILELEDIANKLEYAYHNAFGIDLAKCTKYGNESAEQQRDSYSTVMMYEVANVFDDILGG